MIGADTANREARLLEALKDVEDPELPVSVVDMGLIVALRAFGSHVHVDITFTAMGCPAMDMIMEDVRARLMREPDVEDVEIEVVWDPIWTKDRLTDDAKMQLRA
ncbi:MAG: metal-sulfur cluster assembly factor, partial [Chloroflexi bacterium]|nr:metal-sulfur cluster assembly factor [Chloroflexota bacterium]